MTRRLVTSLALVCALLAAAPAIVAAQSGGTASQAIADCNAHGTLTTHYSADTLRTALATMPADIREYTDCYDVIEKQLLAQLGSSSSGGSGTGGSSSGGSVLPTWLVIVIVVLALAALTFGALAIRRRRLEATQGPASPDASAPGSPDASAPGSPDVGEPGSPDVGGPASPDVGEPGSQDVGEPGSQDVGGPGSAEQGGPGDAGSPPGQETPDDPDGSGGTAGPESGPQ